MEEYIAVYECSAFRKVRGSPVCYIKDTPENIAAYIMNASSFKNYAFIDNKDEVRVFSMGRFLDLVPDEKYLEQIQPIIVAMQIGASKLPEIEYADEGMIQKM